MKQSIVSDVMTRGVLTAVPEDTFKHIVELLMDNFIGVLPVVDDAGKLVGVVSRTDLIDKEIRASETGRVDRLLHHREYEKAVGLTAAELMTRRPITIAATEPLSVAARIMARHRITHLPVVDENGAVVGVVARGDLLKTFLVSDLDIRRAVERDVLDREMWLNPRLFTVRVDDGVVTISGELERRSLVPTVVHLIETLNGVVGVVDHLTYRWDDVEPGIKPLRDPVAYL